MNYKDDLNPENEQNETQSIDLTMPASSQNESDAEKPNVDQETNTHDFGRSAYEAHHTQETNYREYTTASHGGEATRSKEEPKPNNKRNLKGFASTLAAGVIGSVLTLTILPHTDYMKNYFEKADNQSAATEVKAVTAQPTVAKSSGASIADTVEKVSKAIVGIENYQKQQNSDFFGNSSPSSQSVETGSGSGVIFQKNNNDAYIVTNNHVVEGASKLEISLYNGEKTKAEVVGTDALTDLAVLKIDAKYVNATASFGDSSTLRPGDQVYAIGNPLGLDLSRTVTQGIISATNRSIAVDTSAGSWDTNVIQTDAAINPGNSGGALINSQGQVIGINSLKISENGVEGLGFAIPSNDAIPIVNQLIKNGKIERPYIGIGLEDLDQIPQIYWQNLPSSVQKGVMITQVDPHSAASSSGLEVKDVIVSMNGTKIGSSSELRKYLYTKVNVGDTVKFGVYRNGKLKTIDVKLSK
ncbi:PDZ domain-containing protein [Bacillus salipaludis]|uniref:PDZ domain-containing protein n=1 Tax=Bacillus salipaludis TaxID=2547811 RepID=A0A4R5VLI4_9BACI|nr:trypsin-like peptidase domain-containing protein [Bacillus salipaludis]MDQ6599123.1 trypsin-like peptidase domain-containing protein [Bacillus salipaludis]TDK58774.1 PDZ domain-containing protein [Bacillus salipaludis]